MREFDHIPAQLQPAVKRWWSEFKQRHGDDVENLACRTAIQRAAAVSEFCASVLLRDWQALELEDVFKPDRVRDACSAIDVADPVSAATALRRLRRQAHCHLLIDELSGRCTTEQTLQKLSTIAEQLIDTALSVAKQQLAERYGVLRDSSSAEIPMLVLGMGKLGGRELNFSSDVDLVFVFPDEGESDGPRQISAMEYCAKWSRHFIALLDDLTADGFVYRVDTRLRPFGESGPPVTSRPGLEAYFLKHGRVWERYAYLKARAIGSGAEAFGRELFSESISPFVYRSYLDFGLLDSLRDMHRRINADQRGMQNNVKLGSGGIREIEFIVQSVQLLRGGVSPELQTRSLLQALRQLSDSPELSKEAVDSLETHYLFLRKLENFIQARRDQQTHDLPEDDIDRAALALAMSQPDWATLSSEITRVRQAVAAHFAAFAHRDGESVDQYCLLFDEAADLSAWQSALNASGFAEADSLAGLFHDFRAACERQRIGIEGLERLSSLMPRLVEALSDVKHPPRVLPRILKILDQISRRSAYVALLNENAASLRRLVQLVAASKYLADQIALFPALLDELLDQRLQHKSFRRDDLIKRLQRRLREIPKDDAEARTERLARFQRHSLFQIVVCDVTDEMTLMQTSDALTWLAEAVLETALAEARRDVVSRFGEPGYTLDGKRYAAEFMIAAYGKLGGLELSYGSDLDLVFLHDSHGSEQVTNGERSVDNGLFFARLVRRLTHILTTRTSSGVLYDVDTRLRPSGRSGLLVSGIDAFERYQKDDAWTWEHQSLLRARGVAGGENLRKTFAESRRKTLTDYVNRKSLLTDVHSMRARMKNELNRTSATRFDLKHGDGGIGDLEFIVQYLCLREAHVHEAVIEYSDNVRQIDALMDCEVLTPRRGERLKAIYLTYRQALHRRVLDAGDRLVAADRFAAERAEIVDAWQTLLR